MNIFTEFFGFMKEVFKWDSDRIAALVTGIFLGIVLTLVIGWFVRPWLSSKSKASKKARKVRDDAVAGQQEIQKKHKNLRRKHLRLTGELDQRKALIKKFCEVNQDWKRHSEGLARDKEALAGDLQSQKERCRRDLHGVQTRAAALTEQAERLKGENDKLRAYNRGWKRYSDQLVQQKQALTVENAALKDVCSQVQSELGVVSSECERLSEVIVALEESKQAGEAERVRRVAELQGVEAEKVHAEEQFNELTEKIESIANSDGGIWTRPVTGRVPESHPKQRKIPIISVVNLKGGVGKTTLTANLGAMLWQDRTTRVLLVDLDYQGSLTALCLTPEKFEDVKNNRLFAHSLFQEAWFGVHGVRHLAVRIEEGIQGFLVAADDELQNVETQVMLRWLLEPNGNDLRFRLCHTLLDPEVQQWFDYIILDCPPRLTTACVAALTCSNYVLIPVRPDKTSADSAPRQLKWLRGFRRKAGLDFSILGVVPNQVTWKDRENGLLINRQSEVWQELPAQCLDARGEPVHHFKAMIPHSAAFADAASMNRFAALDSRLKSYFVDLVGEMKGRMAANDSRRLAAVH